MNAGRPLRREPLATTLVIVNLALAAILIHRKLHPAPHAGLPPGHPDVSVPAAATALELSGVVSMSPALKNPWPAGAHAFIIARGEGGGPPYAVRRYDGMKPPFAWTLGPENVMLEGAPVPARLRVSVRVDQDGDALTRQLGDLEGGPSASVPPRGAVELTVDRPAALAADAGR